jgi:hypothetical protein
VGSSNCFSCPVSSRPVHGRAQAPSQDRCALQQSLVKYSDNKDQKFQ